MKRKCRFLLLVLAAALLCAGLSGCSQNEGELPVLYLDGKEYPVTVKDGVRGLEELQAGVLTRQGTDSPAPEGEGAAALSGYVLYRNDGPAEPNFQGERKISLESAYSVRAGDPEQKISLGELELWAAGLPVADGKFSNRAEFDARMEGSGYFPFAGAWWRICTEKGAPDPADPAFREIMREYVRNNEEFAPDNQDPDKLEALVEQHFDELLGFCGYRWMIRELSEGSARLGCTLEIRFDEARGSASTKLRLTAEEALVRSWYEGWSPEHGAAVEPDA